MNWNDLGNRNGDRPEQVNVNFYENGTFLKTETFVSDNTDKETSEEEDSGISWANDSNWGRKFELPTHKNGIRIKYDMEAENVDKYTIKYDTNNPKDIIIKFSQITDRVKIRIKKVWDDDDDRDGMRPDSMTVRVNDGAPYFVHPSVNGNNEYIDIVDETVLEEANKITEQEENEEEKFDQKTVSEGSEHPEIYVNGDTNKRVVVEGKIETNLRLWIRNGNGKTYGSEGIVDADGDGEIDEFRCWVDIESWGPDSLVPSEHALKDTDGIATLNKDNDWTFTTGLLYQNFANAIDKQFFIYEDPSKLPEGYECPENMYFLSVQFTEYDENGESIKKAPEVEYLDYENKFEYERDVLSDETWSRELEYGIFTFNVTNKHTPYEIEIPVTKIWDDDSNIANERPEAVLYRLYSDELSEAGKKSLVQEIIMTADNADPDDANKWTSTFRSTEDSKIFKYRDGGVPITYTIEEIVLEKTDIKTGYVVNETYYKTKNIMDGYVQTESTPSYIQGNDATKSDLSIIGFTIEDGEVIEDTETSGFIITNTYVPENIEIKGTVWCDGNALESINGILDNKDKGLSGIKVILRDAEGDYFNSNNKTDGETSTVVTNENGEYVIKVNVDTTSDVYRLYSKPSTVKERLEGAYLEFEYDGMLYTTVANVSANKAEIKDSAKKSKAIEDESRRKKIDGNDMIYNYGYDSVTSNTPVLEKEIDEKGITTLVPKDNDGGYWNNRTITASTKNIVSFAKYFNTENEDNLDIDPDDKEREITLKYGYGDGTYIETNPQGAWLTPIKGTDEEAGSGIIDSSTVKVKVIQNVNLGLFEREQPDVAIFSDISKVEVEMNGQEYIYSYGIRGDDLQAKGGVQTKFQNKDTYTYRRPVNPADIAYINKNNAQMEVYATYEIKVANLSTTLTTTVDEIVNVYDSQYELDKIQKGNTVLLDKEENIQTSNVVTQDVEVYEESEKYEQIKLKGLGIKLDRKTSADEKDKNIIMIRYKVKNAKIQGLLNDETPLNNAVEILKYKTTYGKNTVYAEQRTHLKEARQGKTGRAGKSYAGYDFDSHPGNANIKLIKGDDGLERLYSTDKSGKIIPTKEVEDDTDIAPSFVLCLDEPTSVSGIVWEDSDENKNDNERLGNGKIDNNETNRVKNVKIELYEVDNDGTVKEATLYTINQSTGEIENEQNTVYSGDNGEYTFKGFVTGKEYFIKYIYGNDTSELGENTTTIYENVVNARNYKSTIITEEYMKDIIGKETTLDENQKKWPLVHEKGYSVAVDNMKKRTEIPPLRNGNYDQGVNMYAYTKPFIIPLEMTLETSGKSKEDGTVTDSKGNKIGNTLDKIDFGIIERPREALIVQKTITDFKIELSNGQRLASGDPTTQNLSHVKAIGFKESANIDEVINSVEKRLSVEIDSELIQGAQLEATYKVKVKNNNEIDYDYGERADYEYDEYITPITNPLANYYYYGNNAGTKGEMKSTIIFVDYLDKDIGQSYKSDDGYWTEITNLNELWKEEAEERYISEDVKNELAKGGYRIFQKGAIELKIGDITEQEMKVSKLLTSKNDHPYANYAEIIEIDGKTARTIKGFDKNNNQLVYTPGNYIPGVTSYEKSESDDDKVDILVTPPTGITTYIITYVIIGLVGMIVIAIGVTFIKKKVLIK